MGLFSPKDWKDAARRAAMMELLADAVEASGFAATAVLSGCCWGIDELGEEYAALHGIPCLRRPAKWAELGRRAGPARNEQMASEADALVCLCAEGSSGSTHVIRCMQLLGKPYYAAHLS